MCIYAKLYVHDMWLLSWKNHVPKNVIIIMDYCPSWTLHIAHGLTMGSNVHVSEFDSLSHATIPSDFGVIHTDLYLDSVLFICRLHCTVRVKKWVPIIDKAVD